MLSLKHDYENAELVCFDTGNDSTVTLTFDLALSSYPSDVRVVVQLMGVQASDRLRLYAKVLGELSQGPGVNLTHCLAFTVSSLDREGNLFLNRLFLELEYFGKLRIRCRQIVETVTERDLGEGRVKPAGQPRLMRFVSDAYRSLKPIRKKSTFAGSPNDEPPEDQEESNPVQPANKPIQVLETLATTPHQCHQCRQPLADRKTGQAITIGRRRALLDCPQCERATSVYGMLHRCPACSVLLESPLSRAAKPFTCPQCRAVAEIPGNLLYPVDDTTLNPHECYVVTCPSCDKQWAAFRSDVRRNTVCPGCHGSFPLPMIGEYMPLLTPPEIVEKLVECMGCHQNLPVNCGQCPVCGTTTNE